MCRKVRTTYSCNHSTTTTEYCAENPSPSRLFRPRPTSGSSGFSASSWGSSFLIMPVHPVPPTHNTTHEQQTSTLICRECEREFLKTHLTALKREVDSLGVRRNVKDDVTVLSGDGIIGTPPLAERGCLLTRRGIEEGKRLSFGSPSTSPGLPSRPASGEILWDFGHVFDQEERFRKHVVSRGGNTLGCLGSLVKLVGWLSEFLMGLITSRL
ncbi:hypothetical protein C7212DRAFT_362475 [Tuber magnatum]|uniref:Uncharacterized protein n=1 Tax=Tuber magnatum TaxID=42249 RepID=A0A317SXG1_9PEZI|nr:hypothetical protein C7212DRAFT_362475 [Tuber magnatum]